MPETSAVIFEMDESSVRRAASGGIRIAVARRARNRATAIWLSWDPSTRDTLCWSDTYGVYAATIPHRTGSVIDVTRRAYPALDQSLYRFRGGDFELAQSELGIPKRHYDITNEEPFPIGCGLLQSGTLNGVLHVLPISFISLPSNISASFAADPTILVWTATGTVSASVASGDPKNAVSIRCDASRSPITCRYDAKSGLFVTNDHEESDLPSWS